MDKRALYNLVDAAVLAVQEANPEFHTLSEGEARTLVGMQLRRNLTTIVRDAAGHTDDGGTTAEDAEAALETAHATIEAAREAKAAKAKAKRDAKKAETADS